MTSRARLLAFGSAALLTVTGALCLVLADGLLGQVLGIAGMGLGLGAIVLLVFYEVGLSEDRTRAHEEARRRPLPSDEERHREPSDPSRPARRPQPRG